MCGALQKNNVKIRGYEILKEGPGIKSVKICEFIQIPH